MSGQKPSLGRIVLYHHETTNQPVPAMITGLAAELAHLTIFWPMEEPRPRSFVPYAEEPTPGHWSWPPRGYR